MRLGSLVALALVLSLSLARADAPTESFVSPPHGLQKRLMAGAFDELEAIAAEDLKSRARYVGGEWAIFDFFQILARYDVTSGPCVVNAGFSFDDKRGALERWLAAKPESQTAEIALAFLWERYAWTGRGCDYAAGTSEAQWKAFQDRLGRARDLLKSVDHDANPLTYWIEMDAALLDENPKESQQAAYERAVHAFPTVPNYATARYSFLLTRWFGQPGEAAAYLNSLLQSPGGETGLEFYFDVAATALDTERNYETLLPSTGVDYSKLTKAFASRAAVFGPSNHDMNVLLYYACGARDFKTADLLIDKIGDGWDYSLWGDKEHVDSMRLWVRQWKAITGQWRG